MVILAGITIHAVVGENGLFKMSKIYKNDYDSLTEDRDGTIDEWESKLKGEFVPPKNPYRTLEIGKTNSKNVLAYIVKVSNTDYYDVIIKGEEDTDGQIANYTSTNHPFKDYKVRNVEIYGKVTSLGDCLFYECDNITRIDLTEIGLQSIGDSTFCRCTKLEKIKWPTTLTTIGNGVFVNCSSLSKINIPNSVTSIGGYAFSTCGLKEIILPRNLATIGTSAFNYCTNLENVTIHNATPVTSGTFNSCSNIKNVTISSGIIANNLFKNYTNITNLNIEEEVTSIGSSSFEGCTGIRNITIPSTVTTVGNSAFKSCTGLKSVIFTNNTHYMAPNQTIGSYAFSGCTGLEILNLSEHVTQIGDEAFKGCNSTRFTSVDLKKASIGGHSFQNCTYLRTVTIGGAAIDTGAFENCTNIYSITFNEGVIRIRSSAFEGLTGLGDITIPSTVEQIGNNAFKDCPIPTINVLQHKDAISGAPWGAQYKTSTNVVWLEPIEYTISKGTNNTIPVNAYIRTYRGYQTAEISVANTSSNLAVDLIKDFSPRGGTGAYASGSNSPFSACSNLTSVTINDGVRNLGNYMFAGSKIQTITIPSSIEEISEYAFAGCNSLTTIIVKKPYYSISGYETYWGARYVAGEQGGQGILWNR